MRIFAKMFRLKKKNIYAPSVELESIAGLPLIFFEGKIHIIDSMGHDFDKAVRYLNRRRVIGFDTETRPVFTPHAQQNGVALLQLSSGRHAFLFRTDKIGLDESLAALMANPKVIKVGASVHDDIRGLQKLYPFMPAGFVDLQRICGQWGIKDKSVKKLCAIIMGRRISKTQQLSNWEAPKLSDAQKIYAATDAWICREMYFKLLDSPKVSPEPETSTDITFTDTPEVSANVASKAASAAPKGSPSATAPQKASGVADAPAKASGVVDAPAKAPGVVDAPAKAPGVVDAPAKAPGVVDAPAKAPGAADAPAKAPAKRRRKPRKRPAAKTENN